MDTDIARHDGRGCEEFRPLALRTGAVSQASGSAYIQLGTTKVMVAVYGPRPPTERAIFQDQAELQCDVRCAACATHPDTTPTTIATTSASPQQPREKHWAALLHAALQGAIHLDRYANSVIPLFVTVLEDGGSCWAAMTTAASMALMDAGVEMVDMVVACRVARTGEALLLDPSSVEDAKEDAHMDLAVLPTRNLVTQMHCVGTWDEVSLRDAVELALGGCAQLQPAVRGVVLSALQARGDA